MGSSLPSQKTRAYIYRVLLALFPLVGFYGLLSADEVALWLGVAGTALNILPTMNTTTKPDE